MSKLFKSIRKYFGEEGLALAGEAAPGAYYFVLSESEDCIYDDDSGYYINTIWNWEGVASKTKKLLTIESPEAYERLTELEPQEELVYESEEGHVEAIEALRRGHWDETAVKLAYFYNRDELLDLCIEHPDQLIYLFRILFEEGDTESVEILLDADIKNYSRQRLIETMTGEINRELEHLKAYNRTSDKRYTKYLEVAKFLSSQ